ncbi:MAG: hypothetical protein WBL49_05640 [Nitrososphaeraceae archaeon]
MSVERGTLTPIYFEPLQYTNLSYLPVFLAAILSQFRTLIKVYDS